MVGAGRRAARAGPGARRAARRRRRSARLHQGHRGAPAAVGELLRRNPEFRGRFTFLQLAAPSRTKIERYRELNERVGAVAEQINDKWGVGTYRPIVLLQTHHEPAAVFRYYRAADLCYVSSLDDGMNLVAKEFVAARDDEQGVLVLSQFTGAARDLTEALIVNPYDMASPATRWRWRCGCRPTSSASGCARCAASSRSSTSIAGPAA